MIDPPKISSQAEAMLRRVSPEGRARALKEQQRRQRAAMRLVGKCLLAGLAIGLGVEAVDLWVMPIVPGEVLGAVVAWGAACAGIAFASREAPARIEHLASASLPALPGKVATWLEGQQPALPMPAVQLIDDIGARLPGMARQLDKIDPREPAADAVRKLLAEELPALIDGYQSVPERLRGTSRDGRPTADAQLIQGLGVVGAEIARMTEQLARGAFDELATQNRYLQIKYEGDGLAG